MEDDPFTRAQQFCLHGEALASETNLRRAITTRQIGQIPLSAKQTARLQG